MRKGVRKYSIGFSIKIIEILATVAREISIQNILAYGIREGRHQEWKRCFSMRDEEIPPGGDRTTLAA